MQDMVVTLSQFAAITMGITKEFITELTDLFSYLELIDKIMIILEGTKYDKTFCDSCQTNIGIHEMFNLAYICCQTLINVYKPNMFLKKSGSVFGRIMAKMMIAVSHMDCPKRALFQQSAVEIVQSFLVRFQNAEVAEFAIAAIPELLANYHQVSLNANISYGEVFLLQDLFYKLKVVGKTEELVRVGLFYIPFAIVAKQEDSKVAQEIIGDIVATQVESLRTSIFLTPFEFLTNNSTFHGMKLPTDVNFSDVHLVYLKHARVPIPLKACDLIIDQMIRTEGASFKHLQFVLHAPNYSYKAIESRIRDLFAMSTVPDTEMDKQRNDLLKGAFQLASYDNKPSVKHDILDELRKPVSSLFSERNLQYEFTQKQLLQDIMTRFTVFVEFYLALSAKDKQSLEHESNYLCGGLVQLGQQLSRRTYKGKAMKIFWLLHRLSLECNYQWVEIVACSYFAGNNRLYQKIVVDEQNGPDLSTLLEGVYEKVLSYLYIPDDNLQWQNELYCCLLNLVLLYMSQGRMIDAKILLKFVEIKIAIANNAYDVVRLKYDYVLLKMASQYRSVNSRSIYSMGLHILKEIKQNFNIIHKGDFIADVIYETIAYISLRCYNRHQPSDESETLLVWMVNYASRHGLVLQSARALLLATLLNLGRENAELTQVSVNF